MNKCININSGKSKDVKNDSDDGLNNGTGDENDDMDIGPGDFGEGLKRMISSFYGHTSSNVLSVAKNYYHKVVDFNFHMVL